jgi:hypothetical protein
MVSFSQWHLGFGGVTRLYHQGSTIELQLWEARLVDGFESAPLLENFLRRQVGGTTDLEPNLLLQKGALYLYSSEKAKISRFLVK